MLDLPMRSQLFRKLLWINILAVVVSSIFSAYPILNRESPQPEA